MRVLLSYPNLHGLSILPFALAHFTGRQGQQEHVVDLSVSANGITPGEVFTCGKEMLPTAWPFEDSEPRTGVRRTSVCGTFRAKALSFKPNPLAVSIDGDLFRLARRLLTSAGDLGICSIAGLRLCSTLHVRMARDCWSGFARAEVLPPEPDGVWHILRNEPLEEYVNAN